MVLTAERLRLEAVPQDVGGIAFPVQGPRSLSRPHRDREHGLGRFRPGAAARHPQLQDREVLPETGARGAIPLDVSLGVVRQTSRAGAVGARKYGDWGKS